MKKLLLFALFTVFALTTSQSQEVRFGAKGGLNISKLGGDTNTFDPGLKSGFHIGGLAEISFSEKFALQPELLYSAEVYEYGATTGFVSYDSKVSYIRIPILAKYYIIDGLSAEAGPVFGTLLSAKIEDVDVKDGFKSFDTGLAIGASYELNMGLFFSARYNIGLMDINDVDGYDLKNHANTFHISVGYFF